MAVTNSEHNPAPISSPESGNSAKAELPKDSGGTRQLLTTVAKLAIAAALLYWIFRRGGLDLESFKDLLTARTIALLIGIVTVQVAVNNWRWTLLLRGQNFHVTTWHTFPLTLIGLFFNFAMPGGVGGDVVKGYYVAKDFPERQYSAVVSVFVDRVVGFAVTLMAALFAMSFHLTRIQSERQLLMLSLATLILSSMLVGFLLVSFSRRVGRFVHHLFGWVLKYEYPGVASAQKLYRALHSYREKPMRILEATALSFVSQVLSVLMFMTVAYAIGEGSTVGAWDGPLWFCVPVGVVALAIPLSPGGVGLGQAAFFYIFASAFGPNVHTGTVGITAMQGVNLLLGLVGAFIYLKGRRVVTVPAGAAAVEESVASSSPTAARAAPASPHA